MRLNLEAAGFLVMAASNANDALAQVGMHRPSLVLLHALPSDSDGPEVLRRVRADGALDGVSVVLLGADSAVSERPAEKLDLGADGYIVLPISDDELVARVRARSESGA
jgi:DNA-binding response OmpR family regulator